MIETLLFVLGLVYVFGTQFAVMAMCYSEMKYRYRFVFILCWPYFVCQHVIKKW
jgi:hypothetical protein